MQFKPLLFLSTLLVTTTALPNPNNGADLQTRQTEPVTAVAAPLLNPLVNTLSNLLGPILSGTVNGVAGTGGALGPVVDSVNALLNQLLGTTGATVGGVPTISLGGITLAKKAVVEREFVA